MKRWLAFALLVLALNFAWEMSQAPWFASMRGLPFWQATLLCTRAALGDLLIAAIAFAIAAAVAKSLAWPVNRRAALATVVFILTGLVITAAYEGFALRSGKWRYESRMPTLFGLGLLPLLQWCLLPIVEVMLFRLMWRGRAVHDR
jgi:hypothetical protein